MFLGWNCKLYGRYTVYPADFCFYGLMVGNLARGLEPWDGFLFFLDIGMWNPSSWVWWWVLNTFWSGIWYFVSFETPLQNGIGSGFDFTLDSKLSRCKGKFTTWKQPVFGQCWLCTTAAHSGTNGPNTAAVAAHLGDTTCTGNVWWAGEMVQAVSILVWDVSWSDPIHSILPWKSLKIMKIQVHEILFIKVWKNRNPEKFKYS